MWSARVQFGHNVQVSLEEDYPDETDEHQPRVHANASNKWKMQFVKIWNDKGVNFFHHRTNQMWLTTA